MLLFAAAIVEGALESWPEFALILIGERCPWQRDGGRWGSWGQLELWWEPGGSKAEQLPVVGASALENAGAGQSNCQPADSKRGGVGDGMHGCGRAEDRGYRPGGCDDRGLSRGTSVGWMLGRQGAGFVGGVYLAPMPMGEPLLGLICKAVWYGSWSAGWGHPQCHALGWAQLARTQRNVYVINRFGGPIPNSSVEWAHP